MNRLIIRIIFVLYFSSQSNAENLLKQKYHQDWQTPSSITNALYETISASKNQNRDWSRFRALFFDDARFTMALQTPKFNGLIETDIEELIQLTKQHYKASGFYEIEYEKKVIRYYNLASVYSTFQIKYDLSNKKPLMRGLNHFQLLNDGDRWWIISNTSILENSQFNLPKF